MRGSKVALEGGYAACHHFAKSLLVRGDREPWKAMLPSSPSQGAQILKGYPAIPSQRATQKAMPMAILGRSPKASNAGNLTHINYHFMTFQSWTSHFRPRDIRLMADQEHEWVLGVLGCFRVFSFSLHFYLHDMLHHAPLTYWCMCDTNSDQ